MVLDYNSLPNAVFIEYSNGILHLGFSGNTYVIIASKFIRFVLGKISLIVRLYYTRGSTSS